MEPKYFELKQVHLDLLKKTYWEMWPCEYGTPAINCKRPFGDSDVPYNVREILGKNLSDGEVRDLIDELQFALEIICHLQTFTIGNYKKEWLGKWEVAND